MILTKKQVIEFCDPWPIYLRKGKYKVSFVPMSRVKKLKAYWSKDGKRLSLLQTYKLIKKKDILGKRHQIESASRHMKLSGLCVIVNSQDVIIDGNHRMCAAIDAGYKGTVMLIKYLK